MRKFFTLFFALAASVGISWASVTWISDQYGNEKGYNAGTPFTKDGVTVTMSDNAFFNVSYWGDASLQCIKGTFDPTAGNYVFSNSLGENFVKIIIAAGYPSEWEWFPKGDGWVLSGDEYNGYILTWTGNASTVTLMDNELHSVHQSIEGDIVFMFESDSEEPAPAKLPGAFTINANGDKIVFSKGNLQATTTDLGANWTWDFAPNQWSLIGNAVANNAINGNKTVSANGTVDLFGWSTAATYYGINKSWNNDDYTGDFVDWGALMGTEWRTLSRAEFRYIVFDRAQAFNKQGKATVNGVSGYIFLPDEWELPSGLSFTPSPSDYTTNQYDGANWEAMEVAGAVFLPAAGDREGTDIYMYDYGWYWTSTSTVDDKAYYLYFYEKGRDFVEHNRYDAKSVRLVTEAPIPPYEAAIKLISAIGTVELTAECKAKIDTARTAYDALSDEDKDLVTNYETLTQAETDYAALAAAAAAPVIAQIEALPTAIKLSTYFSTYDLMVAARAAYNALSAEVQAAVTNLSKLTNLEAAFAAIGGANEKLSKPFSVGEGQVVYFSHGNLQATYNGTNWSWAFAAHQYDFIGDASGNIIINGNGTLSGAGTVDLFGWVANSSTVLTSGVAKYGVSNSTNVGDYGLGTTETLKGDWGVAANDANIGGNNDWRILSNDEWVYLFKTRTDAASKYGYATVGDVNGVIIIPDAFTDPMKNKGNLAFRPQNVDKGYSTNVYTTGGDWEAMEAAGAVFMPAAGRRYGTTMTVNEGTGFYWSSTPMSYQASYFMGFMGSNVVPNNDRYRSHGFSVRLVSNNAPVASTPLDSALVVKDLIEAIPAEITLEDACVKAINDAREAYNKLSEAAKGLIDEATLAKLTDAEAALTALYQVEADKVIAKINNIPTPVTLKLATRDSIESARAAYEALTADQKLLVSNYDVLEAAEAELATLNPGGGAPAGALNGKFTINAGGDQIAFAKGNLQATTTDLGAHWTWGFAANQWNYLGIAVANSKINGNGTVSENGTVDLFGWSTDATYYGINNSYKAVDYIGDFVDWGPNMGAGWRTLTKDEWAYLLQHSSNGKATVNDKNGYIFLPNDWSGPAFTPDPDNFTTNVYSGDDWTAMENAGAVFLPSGPARNGAYALIANDAKYCSSTSLNKDTSYVFTIYYNQSQSACTGTNRAYGCMVRLVSEGGGATPLDSAQAVKDLIEAIPVPVTLDDACVNAVQAARDAYNALSDAAKGALDAATVNKLNQAITDYTALIQAGADAVKAKIAAIPQPVTLKLATRDSIESARAAYDALTADQKLLVSNYDVLTAAEAELATLNPGGGMPAGALSGKFSIDESSVVYFSKGNLQATTADLGANWTWGFAANQWNTIGNAAANNAISGNGTVSANGTVDLFGWSTSSTKYGIHNGTNNNISDYAGDFVDWGTTMGDGWFTLSKEQWHCLLNTRTGDKAATVNSVADCRYTKATINTDGTAVMGMILFPDGGTFAASEFTEVGSPNTEDANYTTTCTTAQWNALQAKGCVFLPAAGRRYGAEVSTEDPNGYYWSSSPKPSTGDAYFVFFYSYYVNPASNDFRCLGLSVRLVTEAPASPLDSAQAVKDLIETIPAEITLDAACVNAVQAARDAYDALSEAAQGALDAATVQKLTDAEAALTALNQAVADEVIAKINNIPTPVELKLATRDSINNARAAYDALNAAQQALVSNYQKLLDAEAALADLNKGGSASVDIVWDKNTGIESVATNTTSPAYDGITITTGNGNRFYQTTTDPIMLRFFFTGGKGSYAFAQEDGTHFTKVALISSVAMGEWLREPSRIGTDWVVSDDYKKATWIGDADTVKIWDGASATAWVDVDSIVFTVSGTATPLDSAQHVKDLIDAIPTPVEFPTSGPAIAAALNAYDALSDAAKGALDAADVQKLTDAAAAYEAARPFAPITTAPAAVAGLKYTGAAQALITAGEVEHGTLYYSLDGENWSEELPTAISAGAYTVYYKVTATDDYKDVAPQTIAAAIAKADIDFAMPTAVEGLVYTTKDQTLIAAGESEDGTFQYKVGENGTWVDTLPKVTDAGTYQVYYKVQGDANHNDYIAAEPIAVSIAKAALTITAENKEVVYGYAAPGFSVSYYGLQGSDLPADVLTGELAYACDYTAGSNAGEYDITPGGQTSANYDITYVKGKLVVYKADPTFTEPVANTLTYNGGAQTLVAAGETEHGTFEYTFTPNDEESWNTALPQAKNADTYGVYYRIVGDHNHNDYESADAVVVTIAKAALTATADSKEVIYGDDAPEYTVTYEGWQGEENESVLTGTIAYACEYAPTSIVGEYAITPSGVSNPNYAITFVNGKVTVSKAALTITADNKEVTYGDEAPAFTASYEGWKNEDNETVVSGLTLTSEYVLTSNVGEYAIVPADATAQNYAITFVNGTLTVNKAALMITAENKDVIYGDAIPEYTATYSGWKNSDGESVVSGLTLTSEYLVTSNVGTYDIVPANATATNYAISYTNGTLTVNQAPLMITADDKNVIYGDAVPEYTATYSGWKNGDTESVVSGLAYTCEYAPTSNVGEYTITPNSATAQNYAISYTNGKVTVAQAALTITAEDKEMIYGDEHPEFTVTYAGWKNNDDESVVSGLQFSTPYAPGSYIGTYAINPNSATALNYAITFVDGTLTVNKAVVSISGAEAEVAKFADGHANAVVLQQGTLNGIKLEDPIGHVTTASFNTADVAEHLTITLFYELTGDAALLTNYDLQPTSEIFTTEGVIIEPFIPDDQPDEKEDQEAEIEEGIEVYAYGYCDGSGYSLRYHLESGNPDQYKIEFDDPRFTDVDWTDLEITGPDGYISIEIPVDMPTGDYTMTATFRDHRFPWLESKPFVVTFHVNLPETFIRPLFDNTIALVDTCNCFTDIQWYWRASSADLWQPIEGANGYYYHVDGQLTGEYFVRVTMNGEPTYTCGQADMETLYGEDNEQAKIVVKAFPNPVVNTTTVTIENSDAAEHILRIVNLMGAEVLSATFEGTETKVEMGTFVQGNYMISVDGVTVKVLKK